MNEIIINRNIIIVGLQPWDTPIGSNCKDLALEFSKNNRVLYVNSPLDINTIIGGRNDSLVKKRINYLRGTKDNLQALTDNLWVYYPDTILLSINWIKPSAVFNFFNKINNKLFARSIRKVKNKLGFEDFILFNDNDIFRAFYLKEMLKPVLSVYYSRDYLIAVAYWKKHGSRLEPLLIKKSNVCVANSTYLAEYCLQYNKDSFYVGQGCELEMFINLKNFVIPSDIAVIPKPIIGYVGALQTLRLDIDLITFIATRNPNISFVLVGPEDEQFQNSNLHQIKNIYFLGAKIPGQLPQYIKVFDVCINPQLINEVTIGNYPRKIDEYLAMGKPVVATQTEAMSAFKEHAYLSKSKEEFAFLINKALNENSEILQRERRNFAATHTWQESVKQIYIAINFKIPLKK